MEEENEEKEVEKVEVKTSKEKLFRYLIGIAAFVTIAILIIVKIQNQDFPLIWFFIVGGGFILLLLIPYIYQKVIEAINKGKGKEKSDELPEPASQEELWGIAKKSLTNENYQNHIREHLKTVLHTVGKNLIYEFKVETLYGNQVCHIIINAHFPDRIPGVLFEPDKYELNKIINSQSTNPESDPDEEVTTTENPLTGTKIETHKKIHHKKEKKKEEEKEEPLL